MLDGAFVPMIELIPPVHQRVYRMGLEHLGVVVGDGVDEFSRVHRAVLTGQQFQSSSNEPYYVLFEDFTHVKFYRRSLRDVCELEGMRFDGYRHRRRLGPAAPRHRDRPGPVAAVTAAAEIREAMSDRGRGVRSKGERGPRGAPPTHRR